MWCSINIFNSKERLTIFNDPIDSLCVWGINVTEIQDTLVIINVDALQLSTQELSKDRQLAIKFFSSVNGCLKGKAVIQKSGNVKDKE